MSADVPPRPDWPVVFDTVVVNYFLAAGEVALLAGVCGAPLTIPRTVFDPDEHDGREEGMSELRRGWHLHRRRVAEVGAPPELRARSERALPQFERLPSLVKSGNLRIIDLVDQEMKLYAQLRDSVDVRRLGLVVGLGPGEAAMLAICISRGWLPATDDSDAIRAAARLLPGMRPLRIRALLQMAVDAGHVDLPGARTIHNTMKELGFWDTGTF